LFCERNVGLKNVGNWALMRRIGEWEKLMEQQIFIHLIQQIGIRVTNSLRYLDILIQNGRMFSSHVVYF
jgi:hypothetical protein